MLFYHTNDLEITELSDTETDPTKNLQNNGTQLPVVTQPSLSHLPLEGTSVFPAEPPPCPCVEERYTALQLRTGYLPDVRLLGAYSMLFNIYQDLVHQNPVERLDGGIIEDGKWQASW